MHPQYDLFKQWAVVKRGALEDRLGIRYILFGEWVFARHSIHYRRLPHYLFEFDVYDKLAASFLCLDRRLQLLAGAGVPTVPVLHRGPATRAQLAELIGPSRYHSEFDNPLTRQTDSLMEGLYLRTEGKDAVTARAKFVRPEFTERVKQSTHWQHQTLTPNGLAEGADIWS
ncbi:hypothetical protein Pla175_23660 [Pirellulimonas nuda]|uniref:RNA ligase domain-containing protein n=2 Tax=Pirellulimonas nuda TaxID=2528009 RepID=A0A518DBX0_9BACT|nr:hypothetical protein Pla175_23660 [Pirellulimonas nuda]